MATKSVVSAGAGAGLMALALTVVTPQLQNREGTRYQAYRDIGHVLTVCSGHTGPDVVVGKVYTSGECAALTSADAEKAASGVLKYSPQLIYHPMQLAAAISYSYNAGAFRYGQKLAPVFNTGDLKAACTALKTATVTVNGVVTQGLVNRRNQEYVVCMSTLTPDGLKDVTVN
jgi:lysozyme